MTDRVGQQLGDYNLILKLGKGGFSEVYLGEHVHLKTQTAVKVFNVRLTGEDKADFLQEVRMIARLEHRHIVGVLDFNVEHDPPFLVLEYAPNGTLRQRHPKKVPVPLATIVPYVDQVAEALQYAHDQGLIHRDVKPGNMLLSKQMDVLLSDFGSAIEAQSATSLHEMVGTPAYTAPEQFKGNACYASDQYSLGIVIYEWLTGNYPFRGSLKEVARQHFLTPPPSLREQVPGLSSPVEEVILKALEKVPDRRYPSVYEFAWAFKRAWLLEAPVTVGFISNLPTQPALLAVAPGRRISRRTFAIGLAATLAVAGAGTGLARLLYSQKIPGPLPALAHHISPPPRHSLVLEPLPNETISIYSGHTNVVNAVTWSPDGTYVASGSADKTVQVWEAAGGKHVFTYDGHASGVKDVAWAPGELTSFTGNGSRIASASHDKTLQIWNAANGENSIIYRDSTSPITAVRWAPGGTQVAFAKFETVRVLSMSSQQSGSYSITFTFYKQSGRINSVAWSPDGKHIASGSADRTVRLWDAATGENTLIYRGHSDVVKAVAWSPDSKLIASASFDHTVQVWDAMSGQLIYTYRGHTNHVNAVAWSPAGGRIVSGGSDNTAQVWDVMTGKNVFTYAKHSAQLNCVAWSPAGDQIASASSDHSVQVWKAN